MTNKQRLEQAHILLSFMPEEYLNIEGSEFWLEPAKDFLNEKVIERRGDVSSKLLLREKKRGESKLLNHWRYLV